MRVGEDVDLVWRLVAAGWRVRYAPRVDRPPPGARTGGGTLRPPLPLRHVGRPPGPTGTRVALPRSSCGPVRWPARWPCWPAGPSWPPAAVATTAVPLARKVRPLGIPTGRAWRWAAGATGWTVVGLGRAATMLSWPGLVALAATGRRGRRAAAALVLVPPVVDWVRRRPDLDLPRWVAASVVDDVAYGAGVWTGCLREHTFGPLLPTVRGGDES